MNLLIWLLAFLGLPCIGFAQIAGNPPPPIVDSASSGYQLLVVPVPGKLTEKPLKSTAINKPAPTVATDRPTMSTFSDTFKRNNHSWLTGRRNGYLFQLSQGSYTIRRLPDAVQKEGRCYVSLPTDLDLNKTESFTISVEMTGVPGESLEGGLLLGVQDVNNLTQFSLLDRHDVIIKSLRDGRTFASYMPGKPSPAGVPVNGSTNTLMVRRQGDKLHFSIDGQEVESSPYDFRKFRGNGIGFIAGLSVVTFQNLLVQLQPELGKP